MKKGDKLYGFIIKRSTEIKELGAILHEGEHEKSGARLEYLERDDENKTFLISFKTIPEDSTGVFHIIEHSVLCGSEKYPVKEPFVNLLRGSLNTFLNAMTYPDKTVYPVASRNGKDFYNLVSVYLDAVFHPLMLKDERTFMQEGHHFELDEEGALVQSGVVLNEMKGAFSSPDELSSYHLRKMLYHGTCYEHESGGTPDGIPSLTYEQFKASHEKFYHPSNSEIILDGNVDLDEILPLIDSALSQYDKKDCNFEISDATLPIEKYREIEYEISPDESEEDKTRLCLGYLAGRFDDKERAIAQNIIFDALTASNDSPLKKKIIDTGLCEDMFITNLDSIYRSSVTVDFKNVKDGKCEELYGIFESSVREIAEKGIDREALTAELNATEFHARERNFGTTPSGIVFALTMLDFSLYGQDPTLPLQFEDVFSSLREKLDSDYFEKLLYSLFIENESRVTLKMSPSCSLGERRAEEEKKRLSALKAEMGEEKAKEIGAVADGLKKWQAREDSEEATRTLPTLTLKDIKPEAERIPTEVCEESGVPVVCSDQSRGAITYLSLCFDATDLNEKEVFTLRLLLTFLEEVRTENYAAHELQTYIKKNLGSFSTHLTKLTTEKGKAKIYVTVTASMLNSKTKDLLPILSEILFRSKFDDKALIRKLIRQIKLSDEESFKSSGHTVAFNRATAFVNTDAAIAEYYSGYESYAALKALNADFNNRFETLKKELSELAARIFTRERLTVSASGEKNGEFIKSVIEAIPYSEGESRIDRTTPIKPLGTRSEGILMPVQAAYASTASAFEKFGEKYNGAALVARSLLSYGHLWNTVRVQGGAYGAGLIVRNSGVIGFYSYRDPSPARTLKCFGESANALREIADSGIDLTESIIGTVGELLPLLSPKLRAMLATRRFLAGTTYADLTRTIEEVLSCDGAALRRIADVLDGICKANGTVVAAGKEKLDTCKLDAILKL